MDLQDGQDERLAHGGLTRAILGCAFEVSNELAAGLPAGAGFVESVYEQALLIALRHKGLSAVSQQPIRVMFRGQSVGDFYADLLVEGKVIVELKAVKAIAPAHQAQIINYLNATGIAVGLLLNFGNPKLEYRRFTRRQDHQQADPVA